MMSSSIYTIFFKKEIKKNKIDLANNFAVLTFLLQIELVKKAWKPLQTWLLR